VLGEISGKFRDMLLLPEKVKLKTIRGTCLAVYAAALLHFFLILACRRCAGGSGPASAAADHHH
jgi:hypothetical protein